MPATSFWIASAPDPPVIAVPGELRHPSALATVPPDVPESQVPSEFIRTWDGVPVGVVFARRALATIVSARAPFAFGTNQAVRAVTTATAYPVILGEVVTVFAPRITITVTAPTPVVDTQTVVTGAGTVTASTYAIAPALFGLGAGNHLAATATTTATAIAPAVSVAYPGPAGTWLNKVVIAAPRNGTTTHTIDPASGPDVTAGAPFTPTAGSRLVAIVAGAVTSTTPSGWTLPSGGSAVGSTGLYMWHKVATGGGNDTFTTTHNGPNVPAFVAVYEFPAATTFVSSTSGAGAAFATANPGLTGLSGANMTFAVVSSSIAGAATSAITWTGATKDVDTLILGTPTDGYLCSVAYVANNEATSFAPTGAIVGTGLTGVKETLTFAVTGTPVPATVTAVVATVNTTTAAPSVVVLPGGTVIAARATTTATAIAPAVSGGSSLTVIQSNSGTSTGSTFNVTLPAATNASNRVVVFVCGNTTVTTPGGFTLRASQVNVMGHYLYDRAGDGTASYTFSKAAGDLTWVAMEINGGAFLTAPTGQNTGGATDVTYTTQTVTPTAGNRLIVASLGSTTPSATVRTVTGWLNGFTELADVCQASADYPMQGVATLQVTANGSTAYSTGVTYSANSGGRTALIAAYSYT